MERKSYYGGKSSSPASGSKTSEYVHSLHKLADAMHSDYEDHANSLRQMAHSIYGQSQNKGNVKEHRTNRGGSGHKKTNAALGG